MTEKIFGKGISKILLRVESSRIIIFIIWGLDVNACANDLYTSLALGKKVSIHIHGFDL